MIDAYRFRENMWNRIGANRYRINETGILERELKALTGYDYRALSNWKDPKVTHVTWTCAVLNALYACEARKP